MTRLQRAPSADAGSSGRRGRTVPFVFHEVAEYIIAIALVAVGFHTSGVSLYLLVAIGGALLAVGAVTRGRLGAVGLLSRRAHHVADLVLVAALALSPILDAHAVHLGGIILSEVVAAVLLRVERGTQYDERVAPRRVAAPAGAPADERAARLGGSAGAAAASAVGVAQNLAPVAGRAARVGARSLGQLAGAARRGARAAGKGSSAPR